MFFFIQNSSTDPPASFLPISSAVVDAVVVVVVVGVVDVMKIRSTQKIIAYPRCEPNSAEQFYQKVLLFSPEAKETMTDLDINVLYCKEDEPPVCDETGDTMTIVNRIERYGSL